MLKEDETKESHLKAAQLPWLANQTSNSLLPCISPHIFSYK